MAEHDGFEALQAENARLAALLDSRGVEWRLPSSSASRPASPAPVSAPEPEPLRSSLSTADKVALFRRLFRGRTEVFPVRWEGKTSGKSGYAPACANEWRVGVCEKPRIKCGDCGHRLLIPLSDAGSDRPGRAAGIANARRSIEPPRIEGAAPSAARCRQERLETAVRPLS